MFTTTSIALQIRCSPSNTIIFSSEFNIKKQGSKLVLALGQINQIHLKCPEPGNSTNGKAILPSVQLSTNCRILRTNLCVFLKQLLTGWLFLCFFQLIGLSLSHPRSPSAMSTDAGGPGTPAHGPAAVRLRASAGPRRPRPISIATTGIMSTSMYEKGSRATPASGSLTPGSRPSALKCELLNCFSFFLFN